MLFNSFPYLLLFLPAVVLLCMAARRVAGPVAAQICILAASLFFYTWWKPANLVYLAASVLVNWLIARWLDRSEGQLRKRVLQLGLVLDIGFLCTFKYFNFFLSSLPLSLRTHLSLPNFDFPLGISFFTLAQIMYLVDCYEGLLPSLSLFDHATFVSFFPYVISGPIAKAKRMAHQFGNFGGTPEERYTLMARGMYLFAIGLFKKVVLVLPFSLIADFGFASSAKLSALEVCVFSSAYTLQIYFDFSGYTDMAVGSALMLGIEIPRNFDAPLRSYSIIEFWQRWHISLSNFITSYLYTPILRAFRRATLLTASVATLLAMLIAGLWHGPSWTFVAFGGIHGTGLVINQYWRKKKMPKLPKPLSWLATFALVDVAFIFFRSPTLAAAATMAGSLLHPRHALGIANLLACHDSISLYVFGFPLLAGTLIAFFGKSSDQLAREFEPTYGNVFAFSALTVVSLLFMNSTVSQQFVYFKF